MDSHTAMAWMLVFVKVIFSISVFHYAVSDQLIKVFPYVLFRVRLYNSHVIFINGIDKFAEKEIKHTLIFVKRFLPILYALTGFGCVTDPDS